MANQIVPSPTQTTSVLSSSSSTQTFAIKLTNKNYLAWKAQFIPLLNYHNLHGFIDGTFMAPPITVASTANPPTQIPNPDYDT